MEHRKRSTTAIATTNTTTTSIKNSALSLFHEDDEDDGEDDEDNSKHKTMHQRRQRRKQRHTIPLWNRLRLGGRNSTVGVFVLPLTMLITTVLLVVYGILSHRLVIMTETSSSYSNRHPYKYYERLLYQKLSEETLNNLLSTTAVGSGSFVGVDTHKFVPKRPRTIGYYFATPSSSSWIGTERLDPNLILPLWRKRGSVTGGATTPKSETTAEDWERQVEWLKFSKDYNDVRADKFENQRCKAQYEWQKSTFPACNLILELDLTNLELDPKTGQDSVRLIANGYWRDVWRIRNNIRKNNNNNNTNTGTATTSMVLKTMRYEHDYVERNYDRHRRDAVATERLTGSLYVLDIYGFCGNSGVFEFADGGSIDDAIFYGSNEKDGEDAKDDRWSSSERLVVAYQVATGLADAHNWEKEGVSAIAHTDISTSQFVYVSDVGIYKLNDFNRCRFLRWSVKNNKPCGYHVGNNPGLVRSTSQEYMNCGLLFFFTHLSLTRFTFIVFFLCQFRSPEEYKYETQTEKVDVYSMGNVFYAILTGLWPFEEEKNEKEAKNKIKQGKRPDFGKVQNSTDPFDRAMIQAIEMCWKQNPESRATSRQVQEYINTQLERLGIEKS